MTSFPENAMFQSSPDMSPALQKPGGVRSRTHSISSDRPSTVAQSVMSPPTTVSPEATFIATSAASQIVTNDHDSHADTWYDQHGYQPSGDPVLVSAPALQLLNNFLDHLLFNFLSQSRSTTLSALRPAVAEVLKPKLAKDAINNADEELREYLGGGDDEEFLQSAPAPSPRDWDLELVWKRTRLRCMVYSSLGDMEEEEEDQHMEEGLLGDDDDVPGGSVSPAVAIFLTSILEFLGEQALISAGQAAWNRMRFKCDKEQKEGVRGRSDVIENISVEEVDMERVALDRTLGRLWRAWKKRIRAPGPSSLEVVQRSVSREKLHQLRRGSAVAESAVPPAVQEHVAEPAPAEVDAAPEKTTAQSDDVPAAAIPLPMSDRDIEEIEVPGLAHNSDDDTEVEAPNGLDQVTRPKSLVLSSPTSKADLPTPILSEPNTPTNAPIKRSNSLPTPVASPSSRKKTAAAVAGAPKTPETAKPLPEQLDKQRDNEKLPSEAAGVQASGIGPVTSGEETPPIREKSAKRQSAGLIPRIVGTTGAAVESAATVTPKGRTENKEDADESDFEVEEAQILTSSRISIGTSISGRSISPANSDKSNRPPLSIQTLPVRSGSLRLVDVASPRTPSTRSQKSWLQEQSNSSYSRSGDVSRASSVRTQSNLEEPRSAEENRAVSGPSSLGKSRNSVIHEAEEHSEPTARKVLPPSAPAAAITSRKESPRMVNFPATTSEKHIEPQRSYSYGTQPVSGPIKHQNPHSTQPSFVHNFEQPAQQQSSEMRMGVYSHSPDHEEFMEDELAPLPQKHQRRSPRYFGPQVGTPSPPIPEETTSAQSETSQSGKAQAGTIGIVSVDHSGMPRDPAVMSTPSRDQGTNRQHTTSGTSPASSQKVRGARGSQDSTRPGDVVRNFEDLIQSNETIQYTLTPDSMRDLEVSFRMRQTRLDMHADLPQESPKTIRSTKGRKSEDSRHATRDRAGSAVTNKTAELMRSASLSRSSPLYSNPVGMSPSESTTGSSLRGPLLPTANKPRGPVPQARDARIPRESMVEFAEFIRATGPPGAEAAPHVPPKRNLSLMTKRSTPAHTLGSKMSVDSGRPSMTSSIARARLQARDATVDLDDDKTDLVDFLRRGPPGAGPPQAPRAVAPFRATEPDHFVSVGGKAVDATLPDFHDTRFSQTSTNVTDQSAASVQSSINSQSALLGRKQASGPSSTPFDEEDMMPQRKQRRVRDPYAIDFSDEEEEDEDDDDFDFEPQPRRKVQQVKEESLMDFLNSEPPPPPSAPVPFNLPRTQSSPAQTPKKKASAPSLMARFRQNSSSGHANVIKSPTSPARSQKLFESRSLSSRAGPGSTAASRNYIPIQVNIPTGGDLYPGYSAPSAAPPPVPKVPANMTSGPRGRVPMKKFEPRDAVPVPTRGTSDLADFLRDSSPPPSMAPSFPTGPAETNSGGSKLFGRRKKSTAY